MIILIFWKTNTYNKDAQVASSLCTDKKVIRNTQKHDHLVYSSKGILSGILLALFSEIFANLSVISITKKYTVVIDEQFKKDKYN